MLLVRWKFRLYNDANVEEETAYIGVYGLVESFPSGASDQQDGVDYIAGLARDKWIARMTKTNFSLALELVDATCTCQDTGGLTKREGVAVAAPGDWRGTASGNSLPWEVAFCVSLYTYTRGAFVPNARRRRGRVYMPGLDTSCIAGGKSGLVSTSFAEGVRDDFGLVLSDMVGAPDVPHTTSSWHPGVLSKVAGQFNELTMLSVDNKLDSQRRREKQESTSIMSVAWP